MISVLGVGWVEGDAYGPLRERRPSPAGADRETAWRESGAFQYPPRNFSRMHRCAQTACFAGALALRAAGFSYAADTRRRVALLGTGREGCQRQNEDYFRDYLDSGRTLARGALFVYTLPSSALAEASIHFGFQGPLFYIDDETGGTLRAMQAACALVRRNEAEAALVLNVEEAAAIAFLIGPAQGTAQGAPATDPARWLDMGAGAAGAADWVRIAQNSGDVC